MLLEKNQTQINQMTPSKAHGRSRDKTLEHCLLFILLSLHNTALLLHMNQDHKAH